MEKLRYLRHHVDRVRYWDRPEKTPEEAAREFVHYRNISIIVPRDFLYPETPQFISAVARLIEAHRSGEKIEILDDWESDIFLDPMCNACRHCDNPIPDLRLRLPDLEDIKVQ